MTYSYSIRGRVNEAVCYPDGEIKFFLNKIIDNHNEIYERTHNQEEYYDSNEYITSFLTYLYALELHELGHRYNWKAACNHNKLLKIEDCPWCEMVEKVYGWLL